MFHYLNIFNYVQYLIFTFELRGWYVTSRVPPNYFLAFKWQGMLENSQNLAHVRTGVGFLCDMELGLDSTPYKISMKQPSRYISPSCMEYGKQMYHLWTTKNLLEPYKGSHQLKLNL